MKNKIHLILVLILIAGLVLPASVPSRAAPPVPVTFTILHTNDFHGNLEPAGSNPGLARLATTVNNVRAAVGEGNVLLVDAGDEMQGSLLSNLTQGVPVIDAFNVLGYDIATVGNHEFDWGQDVLATRIGEAAYPYVAANLVVNDTGDCATASWTSPGFVTPYEILTVGDPVPVTVGFIGVTSQETPYITIAEATQGLCFKDPAESILHYYDELDAMVDVMVVLSHIGYYDGGYGYGLQVYGDQTLAARLNTAGKPVPLIIGGHSHTDLSAATMVGSTAVVQAHYAGRKVGRADITVGTDGSVSVAWQRLVIGTSDPQDETIHNLIMEYVNDEDYQALINTPIGYSQVDLLRNYNGNSMMADFINDAIYNQLNLDLEFLNDVDMVFNNSGGIRTDWCDAPDPLNPGEYIWTSNAADCEEGLWAHDPMLLTYGQMFQILPFGNATVVGDMTGAQILELLHQSATLFKGAIQPAGIRYSFYRYADTLPGPQPYAWGAYDIEVYNRAAAAWEELDLDRTYRVGTNEFLAPAGQDGFVPFKYMTNISYWGDMLNLVNAWASTNYTLDNPFRGPNSDGLLDGRITRDGTDAGGAIVPITILHHNDSHGNLAKGAYVGYTQLVTLITQERLHNPNRTLLLTAGDNIQGDAMMYYFKSAALGYAADGTPLPADLQINPLIKAFNTMDYDAMTVGNHEYNFGAEIFTSSLSQATFPMLQANVEDDGSYGIASVPVEPYVEKTVGPEGIKIAILGIGNHRVPNYELPSNIPGLSFPNPITTAQEYADILSPANDAVIALTHIGFTEQPGSVEVDTNVDTNMAAMVTGIDTIIGSHSHTNPATGYGPYKYLPTIIGNPDNVPVLINQAYRYNNTLGQVVMGMRPDGNGGYEVVSNTGRYQSVTMATPEDEEIKTIIQPYVNLLAAYNATEIGQTTAPIDALLAYTQETTGANLQTDASVWELEVNRGIPVDFHLSGAMSNRKVADEATPDSPVTLKVADMFTLMPYENSLVVMEMNGPQLKAVLERAYRNYYYYKYVPGRGGYSYYTTCMLDINHGGVISYDDVLDPAAEPYDSTKEYVRSLVFDGQAVDFDDADTYYRVSTVNYLAAGSCNFNDAGVSLWPLDQIVNDTQYYVRDAVIYYIQDQGSVSPAIEGRLRFIKEEVPPVITITSPVEAAYEHPGFLTLEFSAVDDGPGVVEIWADLDGMPVVSGQVIDLHTLALGEHTLTVYARDSSYNQASASVTFTVIATPQSLMVSLDRLYAEGKISNWGNYVSLVKSLESFYRALAKGNLFTARVLLEAFIQKVENQSGIHITPEAAALLIADARWVLDHLGELSVASFDMSGYTSPYKDVFLPMSIH
jgi:2',3'-cyclic-nucleotide 2'-phosphodiesterase (5'-nucleotidase family)